MTRLLTTLALAALLLGARGSAAPFGGSAPRVTQTVLGNGLRVIVIENHATPLANVAMWYRFGSANDPPGHQGLAHALEHMMFRGTRALSGAGLDLVHARLGIYANAETDYESTHYYQTLPVDELAVAMHVEADRMHGLTLAPRDWELERGAVLAELSNGESSAEWALEGAVHRAAYGSSPFAHERVGSERDLVRTSAADLRRAYEAAYQPDNATLVVTGDVAPDAVVRLARTAFGPLHGHAHVAHARAAAPVAHGFTVQVGPFDERMVDVALASHGERATDSPAEEVASELLGATHAPLRDALLGTGGPCATYQVDDDREFDGGLYHIVCHLEPGVAPRDAIRTIRRALRRLAAHPPAATDVASARRADLANAAFYRDSVSAEADYFGGNIALLNADPRADEADTARMSGTAVAAVLRRWAQPVGFGIATAKRDIAPSTAPERRERLEHVAPAAGGAVVEPPWTRGAAVALRTGDEPAVDAFALPNGVRVFVEPRPGNGTVYVRAGLDTTARRVRYGAASEAHRVRVAGEHAIVVDDAGADIGMHGFARELPTMLRLIAEPWRSSRGGPRFQVRPDHAWIAVTGDVDPIVVRARAAELFGTWRAAAQPPASPAPERSPRTTSQRLPQPMILRVDTASVRALMMQRAPAGDDPDRVAMTLLDEIIGGGGDIDSRLVSDVRRSRGLAYTIGTYYDADAGRFYVYFETPRRGFRATRAAVRDVIRGVQTHPVTGEELGRARHKLLADALREQSEPSGILDRLSAAARERRPPDDLQSLAARYGAVTLADVRRVARTRLTPDRMVEFDEGPVP